MKMVYFFLIVGIFYVHDNYPMDGEVQASKRKSTVLELRLQAQQESEQFFLKKQKKQDLTNEVESDLLELPVDAAEDFDANKKVTKAELVKIDALLNFLKNIRIGRDGRILLLFPKGIQDVDVQAVQACIYFCARDRLDDLKKLLTIDPSLAFKFTKLSSLGSLLPLGALPDYCGNKKLGPKMNISALGAAVFFGNATIVEFLIFHFKQHRKSVHKQCLAKLIPLMVALMMGHEEIAKKLLEHTKNLPEIVGEGLRDLVHWALRYRTNGSTVHHGYELAEIILNKLPRHKNYSDKLVSRNFSLKMLQICKIVNCFDKVLNCRKKQDEQALKELSLKYGMPINAHFICHITEARLCLKLERDLNDPIVICNSKREAEEFLDSRQGKDFLCSNQRILSDLAQPQTDTYEIIQKFFEEERANRAQIKSEYRDLTTLPVPAKNFCRVLNDSKGDPISNAFRLHCYWTQKDSYSCGIRALFNILSSEHVLKSMPGAFENELENYLRAKERKTELDELDQKHALAFRSHKFGISIENLKTLLKEYNLQDKVIVLPFKQRPLSSFDNEVRKLLAKMQVESEFSTVYIVAEVWENKRYLPAHYVTFIFRKTKENYCLYLTDTTNFEMWPDTYNVIDFLKFYLKEMNENY